MLYIKYTEKTVDREEDREGNSNVASYFPELVSLLHGQHIRTKHIFQHFFHRGFCSTWHPSPKYFASLLDSSFLLFLMVETTAILLKSWRKKQRNSYNLQDMFTGFIYFVCFLYFISTLKNACALRILVLLLYYIVLFIFDFFGGGALNHFLETVQLHALSFIQSPSQCFPWNPLGQWHR